METNHTPRRKERAEQKQHACLPGGLAGPEVRQQIKKPPLRAALDEKRTDQKNQTLRRSAPMGNIAKPVSNRTHVLPASGTATIW